MGASDSREPKLKSSADCSNNMANYPRQPAPQLYPTQQYPQYVYPSGYPYQQPFSAQPMGGAPVPSAPPSNPSAPPYGPPPPYTEFLNQQPAPPPQAMMPGQYPQQYPIQQQTIVAPGLWDSGARFDSSAQPRIPPPPPGVTPNAVQLAAMQGHNIVGTQQRESFWTGSRNDGGYSFGF